MMEKARYGARKADGRRDGGGKETNRHTVRQEESVTFISTDALGWEDRRKERGKSAVPIGY